MVVHSPDKGTGDITTGTELDATLANHGSSGYNQNIAVITRNGTNFDTTLAMRDVGFVPLVYGSETATESVN